MTELYGNEKIQQMKKSYRVSKGIAYGIVVAAIIMLVIVCLNTNTLNADRMELYSTIVFILAGWLEIYIIPHVILDKKTEIEHAVMLSVEEKENYKGTLTISSIGLPVKKGVRIRKVYLQIGNEQKCFNVAENKAKELSKIEGPVTISVAHGYIAGYEVEK